MILLKNIFFNFFFLSWNFAKYFFYLRIFAFFIRSSTYNFTAKTKSEWGLSKALMLTPIAVSKIIKMKTKNIKNPKQLLSVWIAFNSPHITSKVKLLTTSWKSKMLSPPDISLNFPMNFSEFVFITSWMLFRILKLNEGVIILRCFCHLAPELVIKPSPSQGCRSL